MSNRASDLLSHIDQFLDELSQVKQAAAEDPGTQLGRSGHVSAKVPWQSTVKDIPDTDSYGERAAEHEDDIEDSIQQDSAVNFAEKAKNDGQSSENYPGKGPDLTTSEDEPELSTEKVRGDDLPSSAKEGVEGKKIAFAKLAERLTQLGDQILNFVQEDVKECAECPGFDEAFERGTKVAEAVADVDDDAVARVIYDTITEAKVAADMTADFLDMAKTAEDEEAATDEEPESEPESSDEGAEVEDLEELLDELEGAGAEAPKPAEGVEKAAFYLFYPLLLKKAMEGMAAETAEPAEAAGEVEPDDDEELAEELSSLAEEGGLGEEDLTSAAEGLGDVSKEDIANAIATLAAEEGLDVEDLVPEEAPEKSASFNLMGLLDPDNPFAVDAGDLIKAAKALLDQNDKEEEANPVYAFLGDDENLVEAKSAEAFEDRKSSLVNEYIKELVRINRV